MDIVFITMNLTESKEKYQKCLGEIRFASFTPIKVYSRMIKEEKKHLKEINQGLDYLFSNLRENGYKIDILVKDRTEIKDIENYIREKEDNNINIRIKK